MDFAKGIGILLVVYGHVARGIFNAGLPIAGLYYQEVDFVIYSFHMPLFFFLSGIYLQGSLARRGWLGFVQNKMETIAYPYVVWMLIQGGLEVVLSRYANKVISFGEVLNLLWQPRAQFWYLYVLFFLVLFAGLLLRIGGARSKWLLMVVGVGLYFSGGFGFEVYLINAFCGSLVHLVLGVLVAQSLLKGAVKVSGIWVLFVASVFGMLEWGAINSAGTSGLWASKGGSLVLAVMGIVLCVVLTISLGRCRLPWLQYIGRNSMPIFLAHVIFGSGIRVVLQKVFGVTNVPLHLVLGIAAGITGPLVMQWAARRIGAEFLFRPLFSRSASQPV